MDYRFQPSDELDLQSYFGAPLDLLPVLQLPNNLGHVDADSILLDDGDDIDPPVPFRDDLLNNAANNTHVNSLNPEWTSAGPLASQQSPRPLRNNHHSKTRTEIPSQYHPNSSRNNDDDAAVADDDGDDYHSHHPNLYETPWDRFNDRHYLWNEDYHLPRGPWVHRDYNPSSTGNQLYPPNGCPNSRSEGAVSRKGQ